jgi:hypothetical protein
LSVELQKVGAGLDLSWRASGPPRIDPENPVNPV